MNERINEIVDGDYDLSSLFVEPVTGILDLEMKLKDFIKKYNVKEITNDVNVSLMEWRFFLKAVENMFGILQNIRIKYDTLAFCNSYDDEVI
ncbi:hypothetical protein JYT57_01205 [Nitrosarchaeum koreense]|nr:hypothetical protein [Nitrosarchaeum koreense]